MLINRCPQWKYVPQNLCRRNEKQNWFRGGSQHTELFFGWWTSVCVCLHSCVWWHGWQLMLADSGREASSLPFQVRPSQMTTHAYFGVSEIIDGFGIDCTLKQTNKQKTWCRRGNTETRHLTQVPNYKAAQNSMSASPSQASALQKPRPYPCILSLCTFQDIFVSEPEGKTYILQITWIYS